MVGLAGTDVLPPDPEELFPEFDPLPVSDDTVGVGVSVGAKVAGSYFRRDKSAIE